LHLSRDEPSGKSVDLPFDHIQEKPSNELFLSFVNQGLYLYPILFLFNPPRDR